MDPLSIVSSSIAIAHVIRLGLQKAQQLKNAKSDLLALSNEISDLTLVLNAIETAVQQNHQAISAQDDFCYVQSLLPARTRLQLIAVEVEEWLGNISTCPPGLEAKPFLRLRVGNKAKQLKNDVQSLRLQLATTLAAMSALKSSRVEVDLKGVYLVTQSVASEQREVHDLMKDSLAEQVRYLGEISAAIRGLGAYASPQSYAPLPSEINSTISPVTNSSVASTDDVSIKAYHHNGPVLFESSQMNAISAVGIRTAQFPRMPCKPWCSCICHEETRFKTPSFIERVVGSLFIGYSGMPRQRKPCNENSCHLAAQPLLYVTYFFPPWFLARMVCFNWTTTPMAGPVASLKVQRAIPKNAEIFNSAMIGDVDKIKYLFENGLASPTMFRSRADLLHYMYVAISYQQMDVCRFLLQANADPFLEDRSQWTPADNAWTHLLARIWKPENERKLRLMFSDTECLERRNFTMIHRIVLGLVGKDLETELCASTADINTVDVNGMSPLTFASVRSDAKAASILLRYGADPNLSSPTQGSPLHKAAIALHPTCIPLLLSHGAIVDAKTSWNQTPLHFAAAWAHDPRHAMLLLAAGADPNARDLDGMTPLQWTANSANTPVASVLLAHGADPNPGPDRFGIDPLMQSVLANRHEILELLLEFPLDATLALRQGESLLHVAARYADVKTMSLLSRLDLTILDVGMVSDSGYTALQLLEARSDVSQDLINKFKLLVGLEDGNISMENPLEVVDVDENGEKEADVWVDASEILSG